jgi:mono/diheme cytochrome c family protein
MPWLFMRFRRSIAAAMGLLAAFVALSWSSPLVRRAQADTAQDDSAARTFDAQIAPLLAQRCLGCHNSQDAKGGLDLTDAEAALRGGDGGAVIVAGKLDESPLWQRVSDDEMPPKKSLDAREKSLLRDWIARGAAWGSEKAIDRFRYTSDSRAGYDWWSLRPIARSNPPEARHSAWPRNAIDQFVLAKLQAMNLVPSAEADRRTLIRRLSFDLTGLPPTPREVWAFVADADPQAYERLVDRLLASPDYGERWARHWLDLVRFGESNGFEYDEPRRNAWPYRDWVIRALNRDLPYDEFVCQQLAGDVLAPGDPDTIKATGFLVAAAYDTAGQNQQSLAMKAVVRQDELEDLVGTTCQTFLGLTANCARCHDHKFDPIRQREYYRLASALSGVRHGERDATTVSERAEFARRAAAAEGGIKELKARISAIEEPVRAHVLAERGTRLARSPVPVPLARWDFDADLLDSAGGLHLAAHGGARIEQGRLAVDGQLAFAASVPLSKDLRAKTLEVWLKVDNLRQAGGGAISVQTLDGSTFDAIVFAEREPACWMAGSDHHERTQSFHGPPETEADARPVHLAIVYDEDGTITAYRDGQPYGESYRAPPPVIFKAGEAQVVFGLRHGSPGGNRMLRGVIDRARLYDRALAAEEVAASAETTSDYIAEEVFQSRLDGARQAERKQLLTALTQLKSQLAQPARMMCYAVAPREPENSRLLLRGDIRHAGDELSAGGVAAIRGVAAEFALAVNAPEGQRRLALARWITSPENPLFVRVIVNRLWHYHFGAGLVETPNDFGFNGARPSHPELLDWLAATLIDQGYHLKRLHREICLSATYRQSSLPNTAALTLDTGNRLLWRKSPQRLEAEAVRDSVLAVAGELNAQRGGPGFQDCHEVLRSGTYTYEPADPVGDAFNRRSVYRVWTRGGRNPLLDTFDCPDPSTTSPKRAVTTTPLQALALLNGSFVLRMAEQFAARVEREAGDDATRQASLAYHLAFGRAPADQELTEAAAIVERHGLAVLARAMFNSNEFLFVD